MLLRRIGRPQIPMSFENVGVIVVNLFGGDQRRLPGVDSRGKPSLEHSSLVPGNRMESEVSDPRTLRRERKLLQYCKGVRQHLRAGKIGKPKTQIKWIGHNRLEWW